MVKGYVKNVVDFSVAALLQNDKREYVIPLCKKASLFLFIGEGSFVLLNFMCISAIFKINLL